MTGFHAISEHRKWEKDGFRNVTRSNAARKNRPHDADVLISSSRVDSRPLKNRKTHGGYKKKKKTNRVHVTAHKSLESHDDRPRTLCLPRPIRVAFYDYPYRVRRESPRRFALFVGTRLVRRRRSACSSPKSAGVFVFDLGGFPIFRGRRTTPRARPLRRPPSRFTRRALHVFDVAR